MTSKEQKSFDNAALLGRWENPYKSVLTIKLITESGFLMGEYSSSTGSTGRYPVSGYTQSLPNADLTNRPIAITIHWKSLDGGAPDPSWNWVSAMNGLLYMPADKPTIQFLHGMTASSHFLKVDILEPGVYTESLVFTRHAKDPIDKECAIASDFKDAIPRTPTPLAETLPDYTNSNANSMFHKITDFAVNFGVNVTGSLFVNNVGHIAINGFCDRIDSGIIPRSMCFSCKFTDPNTSKYTTATFTGFIDSDKVMTLQTFKSKATENGNKYTAVSISQDVFVAD